MTEITEDRIPETRHLIAVPRQHVQPTNSGRRVDLLRPDPSQISATDIAWSLSRLPCRNGHTARLMPMSSATYAVWVAMYCWHSSRDPMTAMHGLLDNASLAYIGAPTQATWALPGLRDELGLLVVRMQRCIYKAFDLPQRTEAEVALIQEAIAQAQAMLLLHCHQPKSAVITVPNKTARVVGQMTEKAPVVAYQNYMTCFEMLRDLSAPKVG